MKYTSLLLIALTQIATAHPGHEGHENWPFEDFSWAVMGFVALVVLFFVKRLAR